MAILAHRARDERGFTLVEVLAASAMMLVGIFAMWAMLDSANKATAGNQNRSTSNNLARQIQETVRRVPYASVTSGGIVSTLQAQPGLADSQPGVLGWQIDAKVRPSDPTSAALTFNVAVGACMVDDSKDGYGTHSPSTTWCSATTGTADTSPEDYKRVTVTVTPPADSGTSAVSMSEIVADSRLDGSTSGTASNGSSITMSPLCSGCDAAAWSQYGQVAPCKTFTATAGANKCNPTYDGSPQANFTTGNQITGVPVRASFSSTPTTVRFYLKDYPAYWFANPWSAPPDALLGTGTVDPSDPKSWSYTWGLANTYPNQTPDGYYAIKAIAYDASDTQIDQMTMSFWLNRFIPDLRAFTSPNAGKNALFTSKPDVEWYWRSGTGFRRDYDIKEFKPYRTATTTPGCTINADIWRKEYKDSPVFGHKGAANCQDATAPATGTLTYTLRAVNWAPDGLAETEGGNVQAASPNANATNARPTAPTCASPCFTWVTGAGGAKQLKFTWTQGGGTRGDPDTAPDCVTSYRFYNTASSASAPLITNRIFRAPGGVASPAPCTATATTTFTFPVTHGFIASKPKYWITSIDSHLNESTPVAVTVTAPP